MRICTYLLLIIILFYNISNIHGEENWGKATKVKIYGYDGDLSKGIPQTQIYSSNDSVLYYTRTISIESHKACLFSSKFLNNKWQESINLGEFPDGIMHFFLHDYTDTTIYFTVYNQNTTDLSNIYACSISNNKIIKIWNLGPEINTGATETSPSMTADGRKLYFLRSKSNYPSNNIYCSEVTDGEFGEPYIVPIDNLPNGANEICIHPGGEKLYLVANISDTIPNFLQYIYVSDNVNGRWQIPIKINDNINFHTTKPDETNILRDTIAYQCYKTDMFFTKYGNRIYFYHYESLYPIRTDYGIRN